MKKLVPAYVLSVVISFMLFIYEPIIMYATNVNDFWFDFWKMIIPILVIFLCSTILLSLIYSFIYFINKKFFKKLKIYEIILIISYIGFILLYVQGNFLIKNLPGLDGAAMDWSNKQYLVEDIVGLVIGILLVIGSVISTKKQGIEKTINVGKYVSICISLMLLTSLVTTVISNDTFVKKEVILSTNKNLNSASTDKNFFIFLVDAVDSRTFNEVLEESDYEDTFDNFTYYPDTMSTYAFTRDSIPFIISGIWNKNKTGFLTYYQKAFNESVLLDKLHKEDYDINIYDYELRWTGKKAHVVSNGEFINSKIKIGEFTRQMGKFVAFKYLPYPLKKYSKILSLNFYKCKAVDNSNEFSWYDVDYYKVATKKEIKKEDKKIFQFIHLEGGHIPLNIDENFKPTTNGTYKQKLMATLKVTNAFINRLKEAGVYDNSVIIIMSDHGFNTVNNGSASGRQNPILYIKGIDEHHDMYTSDKPISYTDLNDLYMGLLDGKNSEEIVEDIPDERERKYLWYIWSRENHMVEYVQKGKAWNMDTLEKTGKEFNR